MSKRKRVAQGNMRARYITEGEHGTVAHGEGADALIIPMTNPTRDDDTAADRQPDTKSTGE